MMRVNWTEQIDLSTQRSSEMEKCGCGKQSFDKMVILASVKDVLMFLIVCDCGANCKCEVLSAL